MQPTTMKRLDTNLTTRTTELGLMRKTWVPGSSLYATLRSLFALSRLRPHFSGHVLNRNR